MASGIKSVAAKTGWLDEKFLKHIVKNYSGKDFTLSDLNEDAVISKFMSPSKKVSKNDSKPRPLKASPMKFLRENPDTVIKFNQENPKRSNTKVYELYENYKKATTYAEFSELGFSDDKLTYDYKHGFVQIEDYEAPVVISPEKKVVETSKSEEVEKVEEVVKVEEEGQVDEPEKVVEVPKAKKKVKKVKKVKKTTKDMSDTVVEPELEEDTSENSEPTPEPEPAPVEEPTPVEEPASDDSDEEEEKSDYNPFNLKSDSDSDSESDDDN